MSSSSGTKTEQESGTSEAQKRYKGARRRKWGKWVSEIRVPGKQERLWLGSYSTPEAAAVAHDIASYCFRGPSSINDLNFPLMLPAGVRQGMSPKSIQKAASDAGMAVDAQMILNKETDNEVRASESAAIHGIEAQLWEDGDETGSRNWGEHNEIKEGDGLNISVEDYL